jgi:hypothetical protein
VEVVGGSVDAGQAAKREAPETDGEGEEATTMAGPAVEHLLPVDAMIDEALPGEKNPICVRHHVTDMDFFATHKSFHSQSDRHTIRLCSDSDSGTGGVKPGEKLFLGHRW